MEQKTEASQAVDDTVERGKFVTEYLRYMAKEAPQSHPEMVYSMAHTRWDGIAGVMWRAGRAALKAQPAPTEAQGMTNAEIVQALNPFKFIPWSKEAEMMEGWTNGEAQRDELRAAAAAVITRWDSPKWKDEPHTAVFIDRLRKALEGAPEAQCEDSARLGKWMPAEATEPMMHAAQDLPEPRTYGAVYRAMYEVAPKQSERIHTINGEFESPLAYIDYLHNQLAELVEANEQSEVQVTAAARVLANRSADTCGVNRDDNWKVYGQEFIDDARAALDAARASAETGGVKS